MFDWKRARSLRLCLEGAALLLLLAQPSAYGFPTQHETGPASQALNWRRGTNVWGRYDFALVDAKIKTSPPDTTTLDRRIENFLMLGGEKALNPKVGLRLNMQVEQVRRRQGEETPPIRWVDTTVSQISPSFDATFVTHAGLEIFGGTLLQVIPSHKQTIDSDSIDGSTTWSSSTLQVPRFGVVRRGSGWSGGFYWIVGRETQRSFTKTASDGSSLRGEDIVHVPSQLGLFGEIVWRGIATEFEMAAVQAGEGGNRTESGATVRDDHLLVRVESQGAVAGSLGVRGGLTHQTLSYSANEFMGLDTIPVTSMRLLATLKMGKAQSDLGLIYGTGRDGQSIPEYNASYAMKAWAVTTGLHWPLGGGK